MDGYFFGEGRTNFGKLFNHFLAQTTCRPVLRIPIRILTLRPG
jgi:hypothetical protein